MFSLDRERYNLQNQCVCIYAPRTGTDFTAEGGCATHRTLLRGCLYIMYTYICTHITHTFVRQYISISYIYIIYTHVRAHTYIYTSSLTRDCIWCVRAQVCVRVCVECRQLGEGNSCEISKLTPFWFCPVYPSPLSVAILSSPRAFTIYIFIVYSWCYVYTRWPWCFYTSVLIDILLWKKKTKTLKKL